MKIHSTMKFLRKEFQISKWIQTFVKISMAKTKSVFHILEVDPKD